MTQQSVVFTNNPPTTEWHRIFWHNFQYSVVFTIDVLGSKLSNSFQIRVLKFFSGSVQVRFGIFFFGFKLALHSECRVLGGFQLGPNPWIIHAKNLKSWQNNALKISWKKNWGFSWNNKIINFFLRNAWKLKHYCTYFIISLKSNTPISVLQIENSKNLMGSLEQ